MQARLCLWILFYLKAFRVDNKLNVFMLIGQSNMAGRGLLDEVAVLRSLNIRMFRDGQWISAKEPLHTDKPDIAGVGLGMSFAADLLKESPDTAIGLVPCAVGGTPLDRWMPGADLYDNAIAITRQALSAGTLKGILWHQGEAESNEPYKANSYGDRFQKMITCLRRDLNAEDVPVITGEIGHFLEEYNGCDHFETVNSQLNQLCETIPNYGCASASALRDNGDHLHFNSESLREFGKRYAWEYIKLKKAF